MADRVIPPPSGSGDNGERRPTAPRPTGGYEERPQAPRSGYTERPQPTRTADSSYGQRTQSTRSSGSSSGYPPRSQSARSAGGSGSSGQRSQATRTYSTQPARSSSAYGERRAAPSSRSTAGSRQTAPRRMNVIRCENCGEDYDISYKRCPFCDERPGRGGVSGKRVSNTRGGGYGRPVNPIQIAGLVISLALIASALFIVIRFLGAPIFGSKSKPSSSSTGSSVSTSQGKGDQSGSNTPSVPNTASVESITLNNIEVTLENTGTYQLTATLLPEGASGTVTWSSSDVTAATVDGTGLVTNVNTSSSDVVVTITATCGDAATSASITCKAKAANGPVSSGTRGRIINAEKGLNIRSGPGTSYSVVASAQNGASITILGEENGFYKINYSGSNVGYVSKDYVAIG